MACLLVWVGPRWAGKMSAFMHLSNCQGGGTAIGAFSTALILRRPLPKATGLEGCSSRRRSEPPGASFEALASQERLRTRGGWQLLHLIFAPRKPLISLSSVVAQKSDRPCENSRVSGKTSRGRPISEIFRALVDRRPRKLDRSSRPRISPPSFRTVCRNFATSQGRGRPGEGGFLWDAIAVTGSSLSPVASAGKAS
jgi:hypothetical protein